jgi:hypothetical protein
VWEYTLKKLMLWNRIGLESAYFLPYHKKKKICLFLLYEEEINTEVVIERKRNCTNVWMYKKTFQYKEGVEYLKEKEMEYVLVNFYKYKKA